jgi:hypothetical protein
MQLITMALLLAVGASDVDEGFLYGACKPVGDTGFYKCLSLDDQIVYTNVVPDAETERVFKRKRWVKHRTREAQKKLKEPEGQTGALDPKPAAVASAPLEAPASRAPEGCVAQRLEVTALLKQWDVLFRSAIVGGVFKPSKGTVDEMSQVEYRLGSSAGNCLRCHDTIQQ